VTSLSVINSRVPLAFSLWICHTVLNGQLRKAHSAGS